MNSVFLYTPKFNEYDFGVNHPFKPYRAKMVYEMCYRYNLFNEPWIKVIDPCSATVEIARLFHTEDYIDVLRSANSGHFDFSMMGYGLGSGDNPVFKGVYELAMAMLGATMKGAEMMASGEADIVFNVNGGLHHGKPAYAEGFCYVNDIAVAINYLLKHGFKRIMYVDLDAHHGNGVQDAFYDTDEVLFLSLHQSGDTIYPGTGFESEMGAGRGYGYTVNVPLPEYTDDEAYGRVFDEVFHPLVKSYGPELIVAQIGLDTLKKDPLTNLRCTNIGYTRIIREIKDSCPKIMALGGGGYNIGDSVRGWSLAWSVLNRLEPQDQYEGIISGNFSHAHHEGSLYDEPYNLSPVLKEAVNNFINAKLEFIRSNIFPILCAG
ncbi:MAG TPA: acetoin utilization protein AcuC [Desulfomonilia bacterium]